ncbi:MAG: hypothetical protein H7330_14710, partial [Hymenobacteraceae bacterium]|nr:hypothetical protein [Hymenobacteraceae bacterium]
MTTNPLPGPDDSDFDARLRSLYDAAGEEATAPPPAPGAWGSVEARLRPAGGRRGWPLVSGV